jgi:hypothetical protein
MGDCMRENCAAKARRLLTEGRVILDAVEAGQGGPMTCGVNVTGQRAAMAALVRTRWSGVPLADFLSGQITDQRRTAVRSLLTPDVGAGRFTYQTPRDAA